MRRINTLISSSRLPASPPSVKWMPLLTQPPRGELRETESMEGEIQRMRKRGSTNESAYLSLNGHKKLLTSLKCLPQVAISWMTSSTDLTPYLPRVEATTVLSANAPR